jgi:hypothetical protein
MCLCCCGSIPPPNNWSVPAEPNFDSRNANLNPRTAVGATKCRDFRYPRPWIPANLDSNDFDRLTAKPLRSCSFHLPGGRLTLDFAGRHSQQSFSSPAAGLASGVIPVRNAVRHFDGESKTSERMPCAPQAPQSLRDPNLHLLHDLPIEIDLLHQHEIPASAQPATMVRDVESRLMSIGIEAYS